MSFYAPRQDLAEKLAARIDPDPIFGGIAGLFLAAPRRTGKSTFLRRDLVPLLEANGHHTIYVDLWENREIEPGHLIADALAQSLKSLASTTERALDALPFSSISVGGVSVDLANTGTRSATLTETLLEIGKRAGKDIVFIIDEAQHALSSKAGSDAMFALKAARDAMNQRDEGANLYLVFTGSHRDKLAALVLDHRQPFFGGTVSDFPRLGRPYIDALVARLNPRLAANNQLDADDVEAAFALLGHRPEKLAEVVSQFALGDEGSKGLRRTVLERADELRALLWQQHESDFGSLTPLQRAVLEVLARDGANFAPFTDATLSRVGKVLGQDVSTSDMQAALDALRDKSLVWRPSRGIYALEDQDMRDWLLADQDG